MKHPVHKHGTSRAIRTGQDVALPLAAEGTDHPGGVTEHPTLAACLGRLVTRLQQYEEDPVALVEAALGALALTRTWLDAETVLAALAAVSREQLEWWERELAEDEVYVGSLRRAVRADLRLCKQGRNKASPAS
jgi:hypothetical protein